MIESFHLIFDVIIVGGGPAGSALAKQLTDTGMSVCILEKSGFNTHRLGEFLIPEVITYLDKIGLSDKIAQGPHLPIYEFASSWGEEKIETRNYIFNPLGNALSLDRKLFDLTLLLSAKEANADVFFNTTVIKANRQDGNWFIEAVQGGKTLKFKGAFLVVACGRSRKNIFKLPAVRHQIDNLIGLGLVFKGKFSDPRPFIESCSNGWFYSTVVPNHLSVLIWMTDFDLKERSSKTLKEYVLSKLEEGTYTKKRVDMLQSVENNLLYTCSGSAASAFTRPCAGDNWCLIGDSAQSYDPLSSQGLLHAFKTANHVAEALQKKDSERAYALAQYSLELDRELQDYLDKRLLYYSLEKRWDKNVFWARRSKHTEAIA